MESFFHTLKTELVMHCDYKTRDDARVSLFDYMEVFYNRQRRHSSISYEAPLPFEAMKSPDRCPPFVGKIKLGRNAGDELHRTRASPRLRGFGFSDAKSSPDTATAVIRARLAAGASLAQSCRLWARVRRPRSPDQCRQFALLTSVVETNPDLSRRALDTTPCLPIIGWHVTPRDTAEASVRVRRVGSVTDPMRSCGTLGRLNAIKHLTRHGLTLCVDIGGVA